MDASSSSGASDFKLGDWWVRPQRNELERAEESVHVEARSMAVLVCLGRHAPGVVTKERLLEEVWSDSPYVGEDVISHAIWELRKALGDSAREPVYIKTVPRKGYELVAEILRPQGSPRPIAGVRIDHYDLGEEIGRGAMGVVYEAVDRRLGRTVAIKFLDDSLTRDPKACQRFEREARLAASLEHPNLATVHEVGETSDGHRYLVGSYYRGGSLKDRMAEGPIEISEALRLVRQLVAGLVAAHERGIIHRDIKPANLLMDEHGTLKICDFGIAKLLGATDLTRTGAPLGTPAYKSPEQTEGRAVDHRTDLWSAGVVFFELLTGRRPFGGEYEHAVAHSVLSREPGALEDARGRPVPEPLRPLIARALAKDPVDRFQSAEKMKAALDDVDLTTSTSLFGNGLWRWIPVVAPFQVAMLALVRKRLKVVVAAFVGVLLAILLLKYQNRSSPETIVPTGEVARSSGDAIAMKARLASAHLAQGRDRWLRGNHLKNLREVRERFEEAARLVPNSAEAMAHLAVFLAAKYAFYKQDEDREAARGYAHKALSLDPLSATAHAAEARVLVFEGHYVEGEEQARKALEIEPECSPDAICDLAYLALGEALWLQGRKQEALEKLKEGTHVGGGRIRCSLKLAQFYEKLGDKRKAEREYERVLNWDDEQVTALHEFANFLLRSGRSLEAGDQLRLLYRQTRDPRTLNNLGYVYYDLKLWDQAIKIYVEAHEAFENAGISMPTPMMAIGDIYMEQGELAEAKAYYAQALVLFDLLLEGPDASRSRQAQRAVCLAKLGHLDDAEKEIGRLLDQAESFPDVLFYAARIYALRRDRAVLLQLARQGIEAGHGASRFLDDPAFKAYRNDAEYRSRLYPQLARP